MAEKPIISLPVEIGWPSVILECGCHITLKWAMFCSAHNLFNLPPLDKLRELIEQ